MLICNLIGAGLDVAIFRNFKDSESSDKVLCSRVAISESHGSCSSSFYVRFLLVYICSTMELKRSMGP